jgi:hypothetical protein
MKLVPLLSRLAALGLAACVAALAFNTAALPWFALTASALALLVLAADYAPRRPLLVRRPAAVVPFPAAPVRPERLAA